ncbi:hypothetical protein AX17_006874 [Amanita inopinata Kibby_2008]|nr:hypothetical protein AX17_006874 [Amanita inopinata Kibby_2008]
MPPAIPSATTLKRIHREIADLKKEDMGPMTLSPSDDNLFNWKGTIPGPQGSVYDGGVFNIEIVLASDYPFSAPKVVFRTRIYHMNISEQGNICIDILKHNWSPALSLFKVMLSLSSLLTDPNPIPSIATQYVRNRKLHDTTARQWTERHARPKSTTAPQKPSAPVVGPSRPTAATAPLSPRARGGKPAIEPPPPVPAVSGLAGPSSSHTVTPPTRLATNVVDTPIVISDSDEEGARGASRSGAQSAQMAVLGKRRRVVAENSDIDLTQSEDLPRGHKRRSTTQHSHRLSNTEEGSSTSSRTNQEVIVIDDD